MERTVRAAIAFGRKSLELSIIHVVFISGRCGGRVAHLGHASFQALTSFAVVSTHGLVGFEAIPNSRFLNVRIHAFQFVTQVGSLISEFVARINAHNLRCDKQNVLASCISLCVIRTCTGRVATKVDLV